MRYVMAVLCGLGLLMSLSIIPVIFVFKLFFGHTAADLFGVIGFCIAIAMVNVIWFFVAFLPSSVLHKS